MIPGLELVALRHDLRTPINQLIGYTEMLLEDATALDRGDLARQLGEMHAASRQLLEIVNHALGNRETAPEEALRKLSAEMRGPAERVRAQAARLEHDTEDLGPQYWAHDLRRVAGAAADLLCLVAERCDGRSPEPHRTAAAPEPDGTKLDDSPLRIGRLLIVDDNSANRHMLRRRLERQGHGAAEAGDGQEALALMRAQPFDLVLLDIMMPVMDGFEVLRQMKADPRLRNVPAIVISALDELDSAVRAIEMGAEDYLFKPFDPVLLRARISASLEKARLRNQVLVHEKLASLGALAAGLAHEIKNPLNFVTNFAQLSVELARELGEKVRALHESSGGAVREIEELAADLEQNVAKIREHGTRADSIIRHMLMHSRGRPGERRPTDLNALVREYVSLAYHGLRAEDTEFNCAIEGDYDPGAGLVDAVPQDLSRVFLNVAGNAFYAVREKKRVLGEEYMPEVRVRTKSYDDRVEVFIRDNGPGIPAPLRQKIFDPFFTTKPAGEGTGLGLSISYEIVVEEHKGRIRVESAEGQFTEFVITLPRGAAENR